jgi:hypothetical protein
MQYMQAASFVLIFNCNVVCFPCFTPPCAVILWGAMRAGPAINVLGQFRFMAERMRLAELALKP